MLVNYVMVVVTTVIVGRFVWVYGILALRKKDPYPSWKYPFIISWAGIRGGISLAAALAIPSLVLKHDNLDLRDLVVFLVFSVIFVTLIIQGLSLPYVLKKLGIDRIGRSERYKEHLSELQTRVHMLNAALQWLNDRKTGVKNEELLQELTLHINDYQLQKTQLELRVLHHKHCSDHDEQLEQLENLALLTELVDVQKEALLTLWRENKINLRTRNKLITILDHHIAHHTL